MRYIVVGTAGHIDHGKSALVQSLTGTNPDRLEEEKRRGITIDLGFAHLDLGEDLRVAFVDVPGHERFIKNMLAGVGGIDLVLLVVAADESIKPQTREHFDICKLLEIRNGLVAITKSDLVEKDVLDLVALEIQDMVRGSFLDGAPVVPVSARTGDGLDRLKTELRARGLKAAPKPLNEPFRLPIDRSFVMKGFGAVITGTLVSGKIGKEAEVEVFPLERRARVRGIEVHNQSAVEASAGQRTALNLGGIEARELRRGMVLAEPGLFKTTKLLDCALTLLPSVRSLKNRSRVHFHCWTAETVAEVALLGVRELWPGERAYAQLRLTEGGLFLPGDRFIIRQFSPLMTLGGGVVIDNSPRRHKGNHEAEISFLEAVESGSPNSKLELLVQRYGEASALTLVARTGWRLEQVLKIAKLLEGEKRLMILGAPPGLIVHPKFFEQLAQKVTHELGAFHTAHPLATGLSREDLRGRVSGAGNPRRELAAISPTLFNLLLASLNTNGRLKFLGELVQLAGREVQLSAEEAAAKSEISAAFQKAGLSVPSAREVLQSLKIDRGRAEKLLQILLKEKVLLRITDDLIFHQAALSNLREMLARRKAQSDRLNVGVFKEITGLSRKYAIPLLEYLDRERVTRRLGDDRIIL